MLIIIILYLALYLHIEILLLLDHPAVVRPLPLRRPRRAGTPAGAAHHLPRQGALRQTRGRQALPLYHGPHQRLLSLRVYLLPLLLKGEVRLGLPVDGLEGPIQEDTRQLGVRPHRLLLTPIQCNSLS